MFATDLLQTAWLAERRTLSMPQSCSMWCSWNIFSCFSKLFSRITTLTNCF